jgi:hypothetical protein
MSARTNFKKEIYDIVRENKVDRFTAELQYCKDSKRQKAIKDILQTLQSGSNEVPDPTSELKDFMKSINAYQFKKKWSRLKKFQQEDRLMNFIKDNKDKFEQELVNALIAAHNNDELKSVKVVEYDFTKGKIIKINSIEENEDGELFYNEDYLKNLKKSEAKAKKSKSKSDSELSDKKEKMSKKNTDKGTKEKSSNKGKKSKNVKSKNVKVKKNK